MKKNLLFNSLLFYSTAAALFISISGLLNAQGTASYVLQLVFLPVTLFLVTKTVQVFKSGFKTEGAPVDKKRVFSSLAVSLVIYLCLFAFAYGNSQAKNTTQTVNQEEQQASPSGETSPGLVFPKEKGAMQEK